MAFEPRPLSFAELVQCLGDALGADAVLATEPERAQPVLRLHPAQWPQAAQLLRDDPRLWFDYLACLSALDPGPKASDLEVVYHLNSLPHRHALVVKLAVPRVAAVPDYVPTVPSVAHIWRAADWHEREAWDLMGIAFAGHPDLRRILLPGDWPGHPLRKDYQQPELYHGIAVAFDPQNPGLKT
jgi:NADH-quinone oxidoreductase subunit C